MLLCDMCYAMWWWGKEKCAHTRKMVFLVWAQWGVLGHGFTNVCQQIFAWYHEFVRRPVALFGGCVKRPSPDTLRYFMRADSQTSQYSQYI